MPIQVSGTEVIDNSRNLTNIESFDSTVTSVWDRVTTTAVSKTLVNREYCTVTADNQIITLPLVSNPASSAGWEVLIVVGNFTNTTIGRNSQNIMSLAENMSIDVPYVPVRLTYIDATRGWVIS